MAQTNKNQDAQNGDSTKVGTGQFKGKIKKYEGDVFDKHGNKMDVSPEIKKGYYTPGYGGADENAKDTKVVNGELKPKKSTPFPYGHPTEKDQKHQ